MKFFVEIIFALITGLLFTSCADMQAAPPSSLTFDSVYTAPGIKKDSLYDGVKTWIAETFKSSKSVIELDDKANGNIIGNGVLDDITCGQTCMGKPHDVSFTMKVDIKDEKFRLSFSNIVDWAGTTNEGVPWISDINGIRSELLAFGPSIDSSLSQQKAKSNW